MLSLRDSMDYGPASLDHRKETPCYSRARQDERRPPGLLTMLVLSRYSKFGGAVDVP